MNALPLTWARAANGERPSAEELAVAFRCALQAHPELIGVRVHEHWIRQNYPLFCASLRVEWPPPYKDFLYELEKVMPRKRHDSRCKTAGCVRYGKRETYITYRVPHPNEAMVVLSERKRT